MEARRDRDGTVRLLLPRAQGAVLRSLPARLRSVLTRPDVSGRLVERLFPRAYSDPREEAEYKRLLGKDLLEHRLRTLAVVEKAMARWKQGPRRVELAIPPEQFDLWLCFVNDMRLVLGIELGIQDDTWEKAFDPAHPQAEEMALLHYLTWLEQTLIEA
ncbi:MAG: DUF2017 family protein [Planctomycetes bacterium]|nr:DUF2017 family protein [Planctomycetota bacterium]